MNSATLRRFTAHWLHFFRVAPRLCIVIAYYGAQLAAYRFRRWRNEQLRQRAYSGDREAVRLHVSAQLKWYERYERR